MKATMKAMAKVFLVSTFITVSLVSTSFAHERTLPTVKSVDIGKFIGKWYAVSSLPQRFTKKCLSQNAEYSIRSADSINVLNTCIKKDNKIETIKGKAVVANPETNAELIVTFDNFFTRLFRVKGDYNIVALDSDYQNLIVGSRDRKSLWIMSRTPNMDEAVFKEYVAYAATLGFDTKALVDSKYE